jgi:hypothetical protein
VGTRVPEIVGLSKPQKGTYFITVRNSSGVNDGYKLTVRWINGRLDALTESQEPVAGSFGDEGEGEFTPEETAPSSAGPDMRLRPSQAPAFLRPSGVSGIGPSIGFSPPSADPELASIGSGSGNLSSLLGGDDRQAAITSIIRQDANRGPSEPPSGVLVAFWFGFVPLALLGGIGLLLYRLRPVAMSIATS